MIFGRDYKMAIVNLKTRRWRSGMTMFGVIVGVSSVVTIVSLGQGLKQQVAGQIKSLGSDVLIIRPGKVADQNLIGLRTLNPLNLANIGHINEKDYISIKSVSGVESSTPMLYAGSGVVIGDKKFNDVPVIGATSDFASITDRGVEFGYFFSAGDTARNIAVIGKDVALNDFGSASPIGEVVNIQGQPYIVAGVFSDVSASYLSAVGVDLNSIVMIPYDSAKQLPARQSEMLQIMAKINSKTTTQAVATKITTAMTSNHKGQQDFSVLQQQDVINISNRVLDVMTRFVAGIAAVSLLVGGIGIMNIMLVSVTERTKEIGIRKAVGATNRQILTQYLTEGILLSVVGGIIGSFVALIINIILRFYTDIKPELSLTVFALPLLVAVAIGIVFSVAPALKAAKKDPIKALRGE